MNQYFNGTGVALITPFTETNNIDFQGLDNIVRNQVTAGTDYLVALGTTAETPTLSSPEQLEIVNFIKERASGLPLVVGMGGNNTQKISLTVMHRLIDFNLLIGL